MSAAITLLRSLQLLAGALAVVILVLFVLWIRREPSLPPSADPGVAQSTADAAAGPADASLAVRDTPEEPPPPPPGAEPRQPTSAASADLSPVLYGTVAAADGTTVKEGVFWLYRGDEHVGTASLGSGTYSFAGLRPGPHRLRSRIAGELPLDRDVDVRAPTTRLDVVLPARWQLTVDLVTPEGEPLLPTLAKTAPRLSYRGLTAAAFRERPAGDLPLSEHAEVNVGIGTFRSAVDRFEDRGEKPLPAQTLGVLTLPPDGPAHVALLMRAHIVAWQSAQPGQPSVSFALGKDELLNHTGTVRLRLVRPNGPPSTLARVALNDRQTGGGGAPVDAEGRVTLGQLQPGRLALEVMHPDLRAPWIQVDVAAGANLDLGDILLRPGVRVEFAMTNFEGKGSVRIFWLDPPPPGTMPREVSISNDSIKTYPLDLYPGRYALVAAAKNGVAVRQVDLHSAPAEPIRFDLRPGATLRLDNRFGPNRARFELRNAAGLPIRRRELSETWTDVFELPVDTYTATITDQDGKVTQRTIELTTAGATLVVP